MAMSTLTPSVTSRARGCARAAAATEAGFTLIEVLVASLIVAIVSAAAATAFLSSLDSSGQLRMRAEAQALAEQSEDQLRGLNVNELSNLNKTLTATVNGTQFTVQETADYVTDASGTPSCSNPSADYLKTTSTVSWADMAGQPPVSVTSALTPTIGSVDPSHGTLAVQVDGASGTGLADMNVSVSSPSTNASASGQTASDGCVLFGDLPAADDYQVSITPPSGTYVDGHTGQTVTPTQPDTASAQVTAGSTASSSSTFDLDEAGTASIAFADVFPAGVTATPPSPAAAPAVVFASATMNAPSYRLCSAADPTCPAVGRGDTSFGAGAWSATLAASPLFPSAYTAYAGVCTSDEPKLNGGTDTSVSVPAGGASPLTRLTLPAIVVRLTSAGNEIPLPAGASLVVTDTGCNMNYIGWTTTAPTPGAGQTVMQLNPNYSASAPTDTGLLAEPGMPYGRYTVCLQTAAGKSYTTAPFSNKGKGEIISIPVTSATSTVACP